MLLPHKQKQELASERRNLQKELLDAKVKLDSARQRIRTDGLTTETAETLYLRAHDLKGLGATYEFPLVTRIAGSLCKLIDDPDSRLEAPMFLVDAHIDAIMASVRGNIRTEDHPIGRKLVEELEGRVARLTPAV